MKSPADASLGAIPVLILCGGLGTRLQPVLKDRPKALAESGGRVFIDILLDRLRQAGFRRFILCVGHMASHIAAHFQDHLTGDVEFSREDHPLGTGGAVKKALPLASERPLLILNGDSLCELDYGRLLESHAGHPEALTIVLAKNTGNRKDCGYVAMDRSGRITSFEEKSGKPAERLVNAGIYLAGSKALQFLPETEKFSLEHDVFPVLVRKGLCFGFATDSELLDIGTPDRLKIFEKSWRA